MKIKIILLLFFCAISGVNKPAEPSRFFPEESFDSNECIISNKKQIIELISQKINNEENVIIPSWLFGEPQEKSMRETLCKVQRLISNDEFIRANKLLKRLILFAQTSKYNDIKTKLEEILNIFKKQIIENAKLADKELPQELVNIIAEYRTTPKEFPICKPIKAFNIYTDGVGGYDKIIFANQDQWIVYANEHGVEVFDLKKEDIVKKIPCKDTIWSVSYDSIHHLLACAAGHKVIIYSCQNWEILLEEDLKSSWPRVVKFEQNNLLVAFYTPGDWQGTYSTIMRYKIDFSQNNPVFIDSMFPKKTTIGSIYNLDGFVNEPRYVTARGLHDLFLYKSEVNSLKITRIDNFANICMLDDYFDAWTESKISFNKTSIAIKNHNKIAIIYLQDVAKRRGGVIHSKYICDFDFSKDGKWFASASEDKTVQIWDTQNWVCNQILTLHEGPVLSVKFSEDSKKLISCSDGLAILWQIKN